MYLESIWYNVSLFIKYVVAMATTFWQSILLEFWTIYFHIFLHYFSVVLLNLVTFWAISLTPFSWVRNGTMPSFSLYCSLNKFICAARFCFFVFFFVFVCLFLFFVCLFVCLFVFVLYWIHLTHSATALFLNCITLFRKKRAWWTA